MSRIQKCYRLADEHGRTGWRIGFSYDAAAIATLKRRIPASDRGWDETAKEWWVRDLPEYRGALLGLWPQIEAYFSQPMMPGLGGEQ